MRRFILLCLALVLLVLPSACQKEAAESPTAVPESATENTGADAETEITSEDVEAFLRGENKGLVEELMNGWQ